MFIAICHFFLLTSVVSKLVGLILLAIIWISPVMHVHCSCGWHQTLFVMILSMDKTGNDLTNNIKSSYRFVFHRAGRGRRHPSVRMRKPSRAALKLDILDSTKTLMHTAWCILFCCTYNVQITKHLCLLVYAVYCVCCGSMGLFYVRKIVWSVTGSFPLNEGSQHVGRGVLSLRGEWLTAVRIT